MMERRAFLAGVCAAVAGSAVLSPYESLTTVAEVGKPTTRVRLAAWVGSTLRVYGIDGRFVDNARLATIEEGPSCAGLDQFALVLETGRSEMLDEGMFRLAHSSGETMDMTLSPIGNAPRQYRAPFSLLAGA